MAINFNHVTNTISPSNTNGNLVLAGNGTGGVELGNTLERVSSTASISSPLSFNSDNFDTYAATLQAGNLTINADSGTPSDCRKIIFRITTDASPIILTFTGGVSKGFKPIGVFLTSSGSDFLYEVAASKTVYIGCMYNSSSVRWEIISLSQEI